MPTWAHLKVDFCSVDQWHQPSIMDANDNNEFKSYNNGLPTDKTHFSIFNFSF